MKRKFVDRMALDHFFVGFSDREMKDLKKLTRVFDRCVHQKVVSGKDKWEGVYLMTNVGTYFEMIYDNKKHGMGIAISGLPAHYVSGGLLTKKYPKLRWHKGTRVMDGQKWFDWYSLCPENNYHPFNSWIMDYYKMNRTPKTISKTRGSVERIVRFSVEVDAEYKKEIVPQLSFLPAKVRLGRNRAHVFIRDRDYGTMEIEIRWKRNFGAIRLNELVMETIEGFTIKNPPKLGAFYLKSMGRRRVALRSKSSRENNE